MEERDTMEAAAIRLRKALGELWKAIAISAAKDWKSIIRMVMGSRR